MYTLKLESSSQPSNLGSSGVLHPVLPRSADAKKDHKTASSTCMNSSDVTSVTDILLKRWYARSAEVPGSIGNG